MPKVTKTVSKYSKPRSTKGLAQFAAKCADEKLAKGIVILDLTTIESAPTDFFVVCACDSDAQIRAVVSEVINNCSKIGAKKPKVEGLDSSSWVIMDFFDVMLHIMLQKTRDFYKLEKLWSDAAFTTISEEAKFKAFKSKDINTLYQS